MQTERPLPIVAVIRTRDCRTVNDFDPGPLAAAVIREARALAAGVPTYLSPRLDAFMRFSLPYGWWAERDGSRVAFSRDYDPMWRRRPDGSREKVDRAAWISWTNQTWHFFDGNPPWRNADMRARARVVLRTGDVGTYRQMVAEIQAAVHASWRAP
jgi:hypothetical protein